MEARLCWLLGCAIGGSCLGLAVSCNGDSSTDLNQAPSCGETIDQIQTQFLVPACASSGCHSATMPALGLDLASSNVWSRLINSAANGCGDKTLVVPGHPEQSYLLVKLRESEPECGEQMPLGAPASEAQIACVVDWVKSLAPTGGSGAGGSAASGGAVGSAGGSASVTGGSGQGGASQGGQVNQQGGFGNGPTNGGSFSAGGQANGGSTSLGGQASFGGNLGAGGSVSSGGQATTGGQTCSGGIAYSAQVQPIFTRSCANTGCHTGNRPAGKLNLSAGASYAELVNTASSSCGGKLRVKPADVAGSYLIDKLLGKNLCSGSQMPKAGTSLPTAELAAIQNWICEGAPND